MKNAIITAEILLSKGSFTMNHSRKFSRLFKAMSAVLIASTLLTSLSVFKISADTTEVGDVLFEDDFSSGLSDDYRIVEGADRISTEDGKLILDGRSRESVRILLPESLDSYGDYRIEVSATIESPENDSRWCSVMYRVQNANYPYYHICIRQNATLSNGVEFAERTQSNSWNVTETAPFSEKIAAGTYYNIKLDISGTSAVYSINGEELIEKKGVESYRTGAIGLQANRCIMKIDSIKVTRLINNEVTPARLLDTCAKREQNYRRNDILRIYRERRCTVDRPCRRGKARQPDILL